MFKKEVRIIAWDDCAFSFSQKSVTAVGVIFRGGDFIDGLLAVKIKKDGLDATEKIANAINKSRHFDQLSIIMLNGITFAGFNVVDIKKLEKKTGMPVIAVMRDMPDMKKFLLAMKRVNKYSLRLKIVKAAGKIHKYKDIHYQKAGLTPKACEEILKLTCTRAKIPEPLRVAHLIASGLGGHSKGGA
ncbi:MAG: DUF99 family protein [Candidatus Aenigmarchaeota archaeon]|nr:DUF99 family protein [Candidatus Aenigmarchaeota archaeon]